MTNHDHDHPAVPPGHHVHWVERIDAPAAFRDTVQRMASFIHTLSQHPGAVSDEDALEAIEAGADTLIAIQHTACNELLGAFARQSGVDPDKMRAYFEQSTESSMARTSEETQARLNELLAQYQRTYPIIVPGDPCGGDEA